MRLGPWYTNPDNLARIPTRSDIESMILHFESHGSPYVSTDNNSLPHSAVANR